MTRKQLMLEIINSQCEHFQKASEFSNMPMKVEFKEFWAPEMPGRMMVHFGSTKALLKDHEIKQPYYCCEIWIAGKVVMRNSWQPGDESDKVELEEYGINWTISQLVLNGINNLAVIAKDPNITLG